MINVTKTYLPDKKKFQNYVDRIFESGWLTNNGQLVQRLESELKKFLDAEYLVLVVNGTCALQLAYKLLNLKGEVLTTPFTFVATASSLVWEGLKPVFSDIDEQTLNIDVSRLEEKITKNTSAILPVHVFGNVCDVKSIGEIADRHQLNVIYDAAHAFDVSLDNRNISHFGDVVVYSFHSTKIFHSIEGGAIVLISKEMYDKAILMRNFGIPGYDRITELGINLKMNEFQAAMGLCVLEDYDKFSVGRKQVYLRYAEAFKIQSGIALQQIRCNVRQNYSYFPVIFSSEEKLLKVREMLNHEDIFPRRYFYPSLNELPYIGEKQPMPIAQSVSKRILCLPLFPDLDSAIQNKIIEIVIKFA